MTTDDIPQKRCTGPCGRMLPATEDYFFHHGKQGGGQYLRARCKKCYIGLARIKRQEQSVANKKQYISASELSRRTNKNYESIIKDIQSGKLPAFKKGKAVRSPWYIHEEDARRYAEHLPHVEKGNGHSKVHSSLNDLVIVIMGTPDQCGSCGITTGNIFGDVDVTTGEKYGYLCMKCYKIVRDFGGDLKRLREVLQYVEKTRTIRVSQ